MQAAEHAGGWFSITFPGLVAIIDQIAMYISIFWQFRWQLGGDTAGLQERPFANRIFWEKQREESFAEAPLQFRQMQCAQLRRNDNSYSSL